MLPAGLVSLAHAAFFGIGAYACALLGIHTGLPLAVNVLVAASLGALTSLCISLPSLRLHGDYFVIATFAFQVIVFGTLNNWIELTGGPSGLAGIPQPVFAGCVIHSRWCYVLLTGALAVIAILVNRRLTTGAYGRVVHAIREDEVLAQALGKSTVRIKSTVVAIGAAIAATAGGVYAHYMAFIDPTGFTVAESVLVLSMVIAGGAGSLWGPVLGAALLVLLPESLRFVGVSSGAAANLRQIAYGGVLVGLMAFRPRGILGRYAFDKR